LYLFVVHLVPRPYFFIWLKEARIGLTLKNDGMVNILVAEEYHRPDFNEMIKTTVSLLVKYNIRFDNGCRIFVDSANNERSQQNAGERHTDKLFDVFDDNPNNNGKIHAHNNMHDDTGVTCTFLLNLTLPSFFRKQHHMMTFILAVLALI
jgi:hypothetical protein